MDVKSLKTPSALAAWAVARLSSLRRKYTTQNRINGCEGWCVCVCAHVVMCLHACLCVCISLLLRADCKLAISHS